MKLSTALGLSSLVFIGVVAGGNLVIWNYGHMASNCKTSYEDARLELAALGGCDKLRSCSFTQQDLARIQGKVTALKAACPNEAAKLPNPSLALVDTRPAGLPTRGETPL